ncbi:hypothetical protein M3Y99_01488200 [Aphelenchoides fujianensis]|nr:hypothetical protein M3Y99_01488200 [Aphelenchoides fujianensis]
MIPGSSSSRTVLGNRASGSTDENHGYERIRTTGGPPFPVPHPRSSPSVSVPADTDPESSYELPTAPPVFPRTNPPSARRNQTPTTMMTTASDSWLESRPPPRLPNTRSPFITDQHAVHFETRNGGILRNPFVMHERDELLSHPSNPKLNAGPQRESSGKNRRHSTHSNRSHFTHGGVLLIAVLAFAWALYGIATNIWTAWEYNSDDSSVNRHGHQLRDQLGLTVQHEACVAAVVHTIFIVCIVLLIYGESSRRTAFYWPFIVFSGVEVAFGLGIIGFYAAILLTEVSHLEAADRHEVESTIMSQLIYYGIAAALFAFFAWAVRRLQQKN